MASHSSTLAWKIPWMEEPGGLQSMGSLQVSRDWATSLSRNGEGNGNPLQCSCLENPRDSRAWWAAVYGVAQSRTWLKRLNSSSSSSKFILMSPTLIHYHIDHFSFLPIFISELPLQQRDACFHQLPSTHLIIQFQRTCIIVSECFTHTSVGNI